MGDVTRSIGSGYPALPARAFSIHLWTLQHRARWLFLEKKATWHPGFCKELNRKCCNRADSSRFSSNPRDCAEPNAHRRGRSPVLGLLKKGKNPQLCRGRSGSLIFRELSPDSFRQMDFAERSIPFRSIRPDSLACRIATCSAIGPISFPFKAPVGMAGTSSIEVQASQSRPVPAAA